MYPPPQNKDMALLGADLCDCCSSAMLLVLTSISHSKRQKTESQDNGLHKKGMPLASQNDLQAAFEREFLVFQFAHAESVGVPNMINGWSQLRRQILASNVKFLQPTSNIVL